MNLLLRGTVAFEDDRCWIDNENLNGHLDCSPVSVLGDAGWEYLEKGTSGVPKEVVSKDSLMQSQNVCGRPRVNSLRTDSDNVSLDDGNCHQVLGPKRMNKTLGFPSGLTFKNDFWAGGEADNLVDVQIQAASESNMSSGHSVSIEPVFNSATGLYSVKPKYAPHLKGNNLGIFESHFKVVQNRGSVSSPKIRVQSKQRSSREGSGGSIPKGRKDVFGAAFEDDAMVAEARATLEWPFSIASSAEFVQEPVSLRRLVYEEVYYERGSAASVGGRARFVL
ncbi:hypothetical protein V6N11_070268 [Hibiscus sabdariffa]|uniref:Uncharacterized protein n=1 Tax=Hibiscus sabdariffa TaxID=183260 RepID=A0ABR2QEX6_9ROSI